MALSLQRKLELAGDLAKVQPLLQRLHLIEKPKQSHRLRNVPLVGALIGAVAAVALALGSRRCRPDEAAVDNRDDVEVGSAAGETPPGTDN